MNMQGIWKKPRRPEKVMHHVMWAESSRPGANLKVVNRPGVTVEKGGNCRECGRGCGGQKKNGDEK